jgi:hypothetical protein
MTYKSKSSLTLAGMRLSAAMFLLASTLNAQDLSSQLAKPANYQPKATTTLKQLIEVAQHYRIPMGIEWIHDEKTEAAPLPEATKSRTVNDLISAILQHSPGYVALSRDGVLQIAKTDFLDEPDNFLNLRLSEFKMQDANVFDAELLLKIHILMTLHPTNGYGGGYDYGGPRDDGFDKKNITLAGNDLSVREILNKIAIANGNALWVVQFSPSQKMASEPFRAQVSLDDGQTQPDFYFHFIALGKSLLQ